MMSTRGRAVEYRDRLKIHRRHVRFIFPSYPSYPGYLDYLDYPDYPPGQFISDP